jgi:hypothetical protein
MKPVRILVARSVLMVRSTFHSRTRSARRLWYDAVQLTHHQGGALVAQQGQAGPGAVELVEVDLGQGERFFMVGAADEQLPLGSKTVEPPQKLRPSSKPTRLEWTTKDVNRLA